MKLFKRKLFKMALEEYENRKEEESSVVNRKFSSEVEVP